MGVKAASLAENRAEIFEALKSDFGKDLSDSPQPPQSQIAEIQGGLDSEVQEAIGGTRVTNLVVRYGSADISGRGSAAERRMDGAVVGHHENRPKSGGSMKGWLGRMAIALIVLVAATTQGVAAQDVCTPPSIKKKFRISWPRLTHNPKT